MNRGRSSALCKFPQPFIPASAGDRNTRVWTACFGTCEQMSECPYLKTDRRFFEKRALPPDRVPLILGRLTSNPEIEARRLGEPASGKFELVSVPHSESSAATGIPDRPRRDGIGAEINPTGGRSRATAG